MVIHIATAAANAAKKALERECPQCHHKQVVASRRRTEPATCEKCGSSIPPKSER